MRKSKDRPYLELGKRISTLRKNKGWSQESLASESGVAISALKDIERGVAEGYLSTRMDLADSLGCSLSDFYKTLGKRKSVPDLAEAIEFLSKFSALSPVRQKFVLALVFDDESYLSDQPALAQSYRAFGKVPGKI